MKHILVGKSKICILLITLDLCFKMPKPKVGYVLASKFKKLG